MRSRLFIALFLGFVMTARTQQLTQYTQWMQHQFAINPAHAGIKSCMDIQTLYRAQWVGFDGAPRSGLITATAPIKTKRKQVFSARHGWGLKFENDQLGQFNFSRFNLAYAAHFNFTPETRLSLGLYGGIVQTSTDVSAMTAAQSDPAVQKEVNFISPDVTFGAWWNGENYYLGLILNNLYGSTWRDLGTESKFRFHAILNAGYRLPINKHFTFLPSSMLKIPIAGPPTLDLNVLFNYQDQFVFGPGLRTQDAVLFIVGYKTGKISIYYSYDFPISQVRKASSGTHELSLNFSTCGRDRQTRTSCALFE